MAVFYGLYFFAFRQFTFHTLNRFYLLCTLCLSFIIPLISFETTKVVKVSPAIVVEKSPITSTHGHTPAHAPVYESHAIATVPPANKTPDWRFYIVSGYIIVATIMMLFLCAKLFKIYELSQKAIKADNLRIVQGDGQLSNASFFNLIFLNTNGLTDNEKAQIIAHECIHIKHLHSIDVLLVELCKIILWFNPIIYFYKKSLVQVHEFEADQNTIQKFDSKNYAHLLLKLGINHNVDLTNQFSLHPLSTRIKFLFKKRTISIKRVFYMLGLPFLALGIFAFAQRHEKLIYEVATRASERINNKIGSLSEALKSIEKDSLPNQKEAKPIMSSALLDSSRYKIMANPFLLKTPEVAYPDYTKNPMIGGEVTITTTSKNTPEHYSFDFFKNGKYVTEGASADSIKFFQNGKELLNLQDFEFIYGKGIIISAIFKEHVRSETLGLTLQISKTRPYTSPVKQGGISLPFKSTPTLNSPWRYKINLATQQNFNTDTLRTFMPANFLGKEPLVIINGREYHPNILHKINPRAFGWSYLAMPNEQKAINKYGEKARDGVLEVRTINDFLFKSEKEHQLALENIQRELDALRIYKNDKIVKVRLLDNEGKEFERRIIRGFKGEDRSVTIDLPLDGVMAYKIDGQKASEAEVINCKAPFISSAYSVNDYYALRDLSTK
jgi:beta-lactamase regulating signal transducer with metallopeptidase domain